MTAVELLRTDLLSQIEQADEKLLRIVSSVLEAVREEYVEKAVEEKPVCDYTEHVKPMTREEMSNELRESMADYERGNYITLEESANEAATW